MLAMVAANPGEPVLQIAAIQELVDHLRNDETQGAAARLMTFGIGLLERVIVAVGRLPERRLFRISSAIDLHESIRQHKPDVRHLTAHVQKHESRHPTPISQASAHGILEMIRKGTRRGSLPNCGRLIRE